MYKVVGSNPTQGSNISSKKKCLGIWFVLLCFVFLKYLGLYHAHTCIHVHCVVSSQLLQDLEEMRGELQQAKKQKSRAEAAVAAMEEEVTHFKSAQRRSTSSSRPATEETRKELRK